LCRPFSHLARGRDKLEYRLNACSEAEVCGIEAFSGLDRFLFPSRNASRCDANLRASP